MNCHMAISQQRQSLPLAQRGNRWWCWSQQDDTVAEALLATEHSTREQLAGARRPSACCSPLVATGGPVAAASSTFG
jgi:hypothetical protein